MRRVLTEYALPAKEARRSLATLGKILPDRFLIKAAHLKNDLWNFDSEDSGPGFDNRSWAFLEKQQLLFEKQLRNKNYLFSKNQTTKPKQFYLKSMDSRSGYRGIKRIKRR